MKNLYLKNKEIFNYLIVGVLTTLISLAIYYACIWTFADPNNSIMLQVANIISWIGSVIFAYITNRKYVFESKNQSILNEIVKFFTSRLISLLMDMAIMFLLVTIMKQNPNYCKLISQVVVIVMNYVLAKFMVFNHVEEEIKEDTDKS